ncbi:MAG TPA: cytochrome c [Nannocystaceae bacterium]|nr:cytochrome c [Nannocystaceae bacterium]
MRRIDLSIALSFALAALYGCNKPKEEETTPPTEATPTETTPTETAEPAVDPEAEKRAAEEREAAEAAEKEKKAALDAQIAKGGELYGANCASCHGANGEGKKKYPKVVGEGALPLDPPKGAKLRKGIQFNTAKDVAEFVVANMPPKKADKVSPEDKLAILAFDLNANGVTLTEALTMDNIAAIQIPHPAAPAEGEAATPPAATPPAK